jgi:hypothetical protein
MGCNAADGYIVRRGGREMENSSPKVCRLQK